MDETADARDGSARRRWPRGHREGACPTPRKGRNLDTGPENNAPADLIANTADTPACKGETIKLTVAPDGSSYTVQVANRKPVRFMTRFQPKARQ